MFAAIFELSVFAVHQIVALLAEPSIAVFLGSGKWAIIEQINVILQILSPLVAGNVCSQVSQGTALRSYMAFFFPLFLRHLKAHVLKINSSHWICFCESYREISQTFECRYCIRPEELRFLR